MQSFDDPKDEVARFRLTTPEKQQLQAAAKAAGETISDYIRLCCHLIPSFYIVECRISETDETFLLRSETKDLYHVGDRVLLREDSCGSYFGTVTSVSPHWETPETLRMRSELPEKKTPRR